MNNIVGVRNQKYLQIYKLLLKILFGLHFLLSVPSVVVRPKLTMTLKVKLKFNVINILVKELNQSEMWAIYLMGLGKEMPDTVTKFDLIKIIHLLSKKLEWIDEDEEPIDQGSDRQDGLEVKTNEESVVDFDIINDRSKNDGCSENDFVKIEDNTNYEKNIYVCEHLYLFL